DPGHLSALRARVCSALSAAERPLVVIVDDLTRLPEEAAGELLRLVASFAGTPNLVFLLALERDAGPLQVLSKVVQVPIDLPLPDRASLQQMFLERIAPALAADREAGLFNEEYWSEMCVGAIDHFLATPRDVVRLVNAVAATLPAV